MDKKLLSQLLDGAAFRAVMLAIAVSQIDIGPHQKNSVLQGKMLKAERRLGGRAEERSKEAQGR
jgi:hypothetical protein